MDDIVQIYIHLPLWLKALCLLVAFVVSNATARFVVRYRLKRVTLAQQKQFSAAIERFVSARDSAALVHLATRYSAERATSLAERD